MKKYLFRIWDKVKKRYVPQIAIDLVLNLAWDNRRTFEIKVDEERYIIEQYIGIKDVDSNNIFKNDIVDDGEGPMLVFFDSDTLQYKLKDMEADDIYFIDEFDFKDKIKIIGNIHENPIVKSLN